MFSPGGATPDRRRVTGKRAITRSTSVSVLASGASTPRAGTHTAQPNTPRALGAGLHAASRALSATSASQAGSRRSWGGSVASESIIAADVSEMEVEPALAARGDPVSDQLLVKDDNCTILQRLGLPVEVEQVLREADVYRDSFKATLDSVTGFAFLVSGESCLVWNWLRRSSSPTTYRFPVPSSETNPSNISIQSPLSFTALVPAPSQPSQREPGLLLVSVIGEIRFWEHVSMALSGVDRWKTAFIGLQEGELVKGLTMLTPTSYLVSTSQSRLLAISITSVGGKTEVKARPYDRAVGWAGSVWSAVFGTKTSDPRAGILALAVSDVTSSGEGERIAYAVTESEVQVWRIPAREEGGERLVVEQDLLTGILQALQSDEAEVEDLANNVNRVEIRDAKVTPAGTLAVLVSHVKDQASPNSMSYAIVVLSVGGTMNSVSPISVQHLSYSAVRDYRQLSSGPNFSLTGDTAFIVFADTVVVVAIGPGSLYEDAFPLRSPTSRFIGYSTLPAPPGYASRSLNLLTSDAALIALSVTSIENFYPHQPGTEGYKTSRLKTKIEQAIFYGEESDNPLSFAVPDGFEGDLTASTLAVSEELLSSTSPNLPRILDLRAQLAGRIQRARTLIDFINFNGLQAKLSQSSLRKLSTDAEKLTAAAALWQYQNARLGEEDSLLSDTIARESGDDFVENSIRTFFESKVGEFASLPYFLRAHPLLLQVAALGGLMDQVTKTVQDRIAAGEYELGAPVLHEANQIRLLVLNAVARHRKETSSSVYGLNLDTLPIESWTSKSSALRPLQWHFDATDALLRERLREFGTSLDGDSSTYATKSRIAFDLESQQTIQADLKAQMASLADFVFTSLEERLLFLKSVRPDAGTYEETRVVTADYHALRPRFIQTLGKSIASDQIAHHLLILFSIHLVSIGKVTHAYDLAERYQDFKSLVELCNDSKHGSISRTRFFLQKYSEKFAFELYQFYVRMGSTSPPQGLKRLLIRLTLLGQLRTLLEPEAECQDLVTKFLDNTENFRISWLNDIAIGRFAEATEALTVVATSEADLSRKRLMLSLAKLTYIAQATHESLDSEEVQRAIEVVDDDLDLVGSQDKYRHMLSEVLSAAELEGTLDRQGKLVTSRVAIHLSDRPAFAQLHAQLCKESLQGQILSAEDLIDLITLKDNGGPRTEAFAEALDILLRAQDLPAARKQIALQSIWRRCYNRDENYRDEQIADNLRTTAVFATRSILVEENHPAHLFLSPSDSAFQGSAEELAARFSTAPAHLIDMYLEDYQTENQQLDEGLSSGLDVYASEAIRLVKEAPVGGDTLGDDVMTGDEQMERDEQMEGDDEMMMES
ncbi:hypothetical protein P7C70_g405, partial [Phenoliferia sp. Uapishka_3]